MGAITSRVMEWERVLNVCCRLLEPRWKLEIEAVAAA
jgi:hypothetical protein